MLTQGVELDGNVDVDSLVVVDLVRGPGPSEQESSSEAVREDNVEVDDGVDVQRRRQPQRAGSTSTSSSRSTVTVAGPSLPEPILVDPLKQRGCAQSLRN